MYFTVTGTAIESGEAKKQENETSLKNSNLFIRTGGFYLHAFVHMQFLIKSV